MCVILTRSVKWQHHWLILKISVTLLVKQWSLVCLMKCKFTVHGGRWSLEVCVITKLLHGISGVSVWVWFLLAVKGVSTWNFLCYNPESHWINLIWIFTMFHAPTHYIVAVMVWIEWLHTWNCSLVLFAINVSKKINPWCDRKSAWELGWMFMAV